jgi:excisionase family DNA binding protein
MMPEPLAYSIPQTAHVLAVSKGTVKNLLKRRELVSRKVGSRTIIPRSSVEAFLRNDHQTEGPEQKEERRLRRAQRD